MGREVEPVSAMLIDNPASAAVSTKAMLALTWLIEAIAITSMIADNTTRRMP